MRPPPKMDGRWPKQARHTLQMGRLCMRGEELAVAAPARPSGRDGLMASSPPPRRQWLLEGAGAALQYVLTASTVTYDHSEHCPIRLRASGLTARLLGVVLEAAHAYSVRLFTLPEFTWNEFATTTLTAAHTTGARRSLASTPSASMILTKRRSRRLLRNHAPLRGRPSYLQRPYHVGMRRGQARSRAAH